MRCITIIPDKPQEFEGLLQFFERAKRYVHDRARELLPAALAQGYPTRRAFTLMFVSVAQLGFEGGGAYADICERAFAIGYAFCPAWVGVQLRLQYSQKELGDKRHRYKYVYVAMQPLPNCMGSPFILEVMDVFDTDLLYADYAHAHTRFFPGDVFVFWRP